LLCVKSLQAFLHTSIVDTQELVLCSGHVYKVRLALSAFLIEKLVHRLVCWRFSEICADDLVQRFPQMRRAALCGGNTLGAVLAGFIHAGINARKANDRTAARKTAHIADLSHELRGSGYMARTISYSGSCMASLVISARSAASVILSASNC